MPAFACETTLILAEAEVITLDQAVKRIKDGKRGKVLGAETLQLKGHPVHVIKVLTKKGHVKKIHIKTKSHQ
ncbi:MAG: hypothetical protein A6F70_04275 [Cycloclasticus sp. symbiont of Bathymodiolus heckerae]|nr:MAG: hypothetical protein A6F70_04275 [Cycloclasticus sp. symbiont of Bathymodiolus heckerae]